LIQRRPGQSLESHIGVPFVLQYTPSVHVAGSYIGRLTAAWAERGAGVVNLSLYGPTPAKDLDFLHGLIRTYEQYDYEQKSMQPARAIELITKQLGHVSDSPQREELQGERFNDQNIITDLSTETRRVYQRRENYELEKAKLEM